jgi:hypothetical protein
MLKKQPEDGAFAAGVTANSLEESCGAAWRVMHMLQHNDQVALQL